MDSTAIWGIVGTVLTTILTIVAAFIQKRGSKWLSLIHMVIDAFEDGNVSTEEYTAIVKHLKATIPAKK